MSFRLRMSHVVASVAAATLGVLGLAGTTSADVIFGYEATGISAHWDFGAE